ncbi:MAG: lysophospholipase [Actinomycetota bacterium]|nr:lysophospholipase [Actinomycetota bacterium]
MQELSLVATCDGNALSVGAWRVDEPKGTVVLFHGIPSVKPDAPGAATYRDFARTIATHGWCTAWADFRGVRGTQGYFSIEGWVRDAAAICEVVRDLGPKRSILVGSSAGGAVAAEAIARGTAADGLALLAAPATWVSFAESPEFAVALMQRDAGMPLSPDVLDDPTDWAAEFNDVQTERSVANLEIPILIVHGSNDDVVPVDHAERIAKNARDVEVRIIPGASHRLRHEREAVDALLDWLGRRAR